MREKNLYHPWYNNFEFNANYGQIAEIKLFLAGNLLEVRENNNFRIFMLFIYKRQFKTISANYKVINY